MNTLKIGDEILSQASGERATPNDFIDPINIILVHGFTANSIYLSSLANDLSKLGINTFLYNYNSYNGIDRAASNLFHLLEGLNQISEGTINKKKIVIVAHSMGGLVARSLCQLDQGKKYISGIFTIGTPHDGTLTDSKYLSYLVKYFESIAGSGGPKGYRKDCKSMLQLLNRDKDQFLSKLEKTKKELKGIKIGSISGGKKFLEVSKNPFTNKLINKFIQSSLGEYNDGLVKESSSDWSNNADVLYKKTVLHINNYPEFHQLNHTYLIKNQSVSLKVATFVKLV